MTNLSVLSRVYTGDLLLRFYMRFLLLSDKKEGISYKCSSFVYSRCKLLSDVLLHILQNEKIGPKIAAKINRVAAALAIQCNSQEVTCMLRGSI